MSDVTWPYSTHDEVSHLVCSDVPELRARIDQLLEERRLWKQEAHEASTQRELPDEWPSLTAQEERVLRRLAEASDNKPVSKEVLFRAAVNGIDTDICANIVNVVICKLRQKLGGYAIITTFHGKGFSLNTEARDLLKGF